MLHTRRFEGPASARALFLRNLPSRVDRPRLVVTLQRNPARSSAVAENRARTAAVQQVCLGQVDGPFLQLSVGG